MLWRGRYSKLTVLTNGTSAFYINAHLRALMFAMVRVFTPVFLYKTGVTLWGTTTGGFLAVVGYYALLRLVILIFSIPISKFIERVGFRRSVSLSVFLLIGEMACMAAASNHPYLVILAALSSGINVPMYWIARDSALSQDVKGKEMGRTISTIASLEQIASILGPFVAGTIVMAWGFTSLFTIAMVILILSAIPLWRMPHHTHKNGVSLKGFFLWIKDHRYSHQAIGMVGVCMEDYGIGILWPLALFLLGVKLSTMGSIYSAVAVVSVAIKILSGRLFDSLRARRDWTDELIYAVATVGTALVWPIRIFLTTIGAIFAVDAIAEIFQGFYYNFHADYAHLGGKRMGSIAFWVYVEMIYSLAAVLLMGIVAIGVYYGIWKELVFATISLWVLASMAIAKESNL